MIKRIKTLIHENRIYHKHTRLLLQEQEWAHVYHDSIRSIEYIEKLPLNIGRWAGGYAFFYVLNRILKDYRPTSILEFGLGESSKFISTYLKHNLKDTHHQIIEENKDWLTIFNNQFSLAEHSRVAVCPLVLKNIKGYECRHYEGLEQHIDRKYDLYVIDGPFGSKRYSRYDVIASISNLVKGDEFIIMFDDFNRQGEQDTFNDLMEVLKTKGIEVVYADYKGAKTLKVIATKKYQFVISM